MWLWKILGAFARALLRGFLPVSKGVEVKFALFAVVVAMCVILFTLL